jgi:hypothetical protein
MTPQQDTAPTGVAVTGPKAGLSPGAWYPVPATEHPVPHMELPCWPLEESPAGLRTATSRKRRRSPNTTNPAAGVTKRLKPPHQEGVGLHSTRPEQQHLRSGPGRTSKGRWGRTRPPAPSPLPATSPRRPNPRGAMLTRTQHRGQRARARNPDRAQMGPDLSRPTRYTSHRLPVPNPAAGAVATINLPDPLPWATKPRRPNPQPLSRDSAASGVGRPWLAAHENRGRGGGGRRRPPGILPEPGTRVPDRRPPGRDAAGRAGAAAMASLRPRRPQGRHRAPATPRPQTRRHVAPAAAPPPSRGPSPAVFPRRTPPRAEPREGRNPPRRHLPRGARLRRRPLRRRRREGGGGRPLEAAARVSPVSPEEG